MTDTPKRRSTIPPPPNREAKTDPPIPTEPAPPDDLLNLADNVLPRLAGIELGLAELSLRIAGWQDKLGKIDDLHSLLMGAAAQEPGGKPRPSIVAELHRMNNTTAVIGMNTEHVVEQVEEQKKTLPVLIAEHVANRVVELFQGEVRGIKGAVTGLQEEHAALLKRVEQIAESAHPSGPNGNGPGHK